jgi:hypothetical protein
MDHSATQLNGILKRGTQWQWPVLHFVPEIVSQDMFKQKVGAPMQLEDCVSLNNIGVLPKPDPRLGFTPKAVHHVRTFKAPILETLDRVPSACLFLFYNVDKTIAPLPHFYNAQIPETTTGAAGMNDVARREFCTLWWY